MRTECVRVGGGIVNRAGGDMVGCEGRRGLGLGWWDDVWKTRTGQGERVSV